MRLLFVRHGDPDYEKDGIAIFRTLRAGEITHLRIGEEEPSFSARFCERYENMDERH